MQIPAINILKGHMSVSQKASPLQWLAIRKVLQVLVPGKTWDVPQDSSLALVPLPLASSVASSSMHPYDGSLADAYIPDVSGLRSHIEALMDIQLEVFLFFLARCL